METPGPPPAPRPLGRLGPLFAAVWLVFLVDPVRAAAGDLPAVRAGVGLVATVAFAASYVGLWVALRTDRARLRAVPPLPVRLAWTALLVGLGAVMVATLGQVGTASVVYLAVTFVVLYPLAVSVPVVLVLAAAVLLTGWPWTAGSTAPGWRSRSSPPRSRCSGCAR